MDKPKIAIHNSQTNKFIEREMNEAELADLQARQAEGQAKAIAAATKEAARAALLTKLGITADEAQLLLGSN